VLEDALAGTGTEAEAPAAVGRQAQPARRRLTLERWVWVAVVLALAGVASLSILPRPTERPEAQHFTFDTPEGVTLADFNPLAVSPDGRFFVFAGRSPAGTAQLWIRPVGAPDVPRELPGTEGAGQPFWSPDSASIGFFAGGELKKVSLASGIVQRICVLPPGGTDPAGTWSSEDTIVFSLGLGGLRLYAVSASSSGGRATPLTTPDERTQHWWPQFLPDGRRFLFEIYGPPAETGEYPENVGVYVGSLDAPDERRRLLPVPMRARYGSGHLLFVQDGRTLMAQPFDVARAELTGDPVAVASPVAQGLVPRWGWFSVSATGVLAYVEGTTSDTQLVWLDRAGNRLSTLGDPAPYLQITLSPDGRRVAALMIAGTGRNDIWVIDARGIASPVTTGGGAGSPVWSPDSEELIFLSYNSANRRLFYRKEPRADATASALREMALGGTPEDWFDDGKTLLYRTSGEENALWALPVEGDGPPEQVLKSAFSVSGAQISPDGRWLAYVSDESGRDQVYVRPSGRPGAPERVSRDGGGQPRWRGDGKELELFYLSHDGGLMAVNVREGASGLEVETPEVLVPADALTDVVGSYEVAPGGQSFLVRMRVEEDVTQRIHVVTNWSSLLE
jgi:Tol biopolymer transport system component